MESPRDVETGEGTKMATEDGYKSMLPDELSIGESKRNTKVSVGKESVTVVYTW